MFVLSQYRLSHPLWLCALSLLHIPRLGAAHLLPRHWLHRSTSLACRKNNTEIVACCRYVVAACISERDLPTTGELHEGACVFVRTTTPFTTSPPRKQSPILTLSFSVARISCTRITPVKSSPGGKGTPSTTVIETTACWGDNRVTEPITTEFGAGGWGLTRCIESVCDHSSRTREREKR
jgi:hypothetical protein